MVDVAGANFHVHELGAGVPVILEAGIAATSISWALVQQAAAKIAHVIAYDRAGLGWSDPARTPRTPSHIAAELEALLAAASIQPPYVLVGHSFGGLVVERFAIDYPDKVAALILVDPLSPQEFYPLSSRKRHMLARAAALSRRGAFLAHVGVVRACLNLVLSGNQIVPMLAARVSSGKGGSGLTSRLAGEIRKLPRDLWPIVASHWCSPKSFEGMAQHLESLARSCEEMSGACLPQLPVTVISAAKNQQGPGVELPRDARVVSAEHSGHWVQLDQPELVIEAIREFV
jgi:pimeloyl-ACP methyl ester carboxylesterase